MKNMKVIVEALAVGKLVLLPSVCGWGICCSVKKLESVIRLCKIRNSFDKGDEVVFISTSVSLCDYASNVPEMAFTLLDIADKPLIITLQDWNACISGEGLFANGVSLCMDGGEVVREVLRLLRSDLLFVPLGAAQLALISGNLADFADLIYNNGQSYLEAFPLPGHIMFSNNGSFKILRN